MAFVMVLSWSRQIYLRFYLDARMDSFLAGHAGAFEAWSGLPRVLLLDFVPWNKIVVLCPTPLCGPSRRVGGLVRRAANMWAHNRLQRVEPLKEGFVVLPGSTSVGCPRDSSYLTST